MNIKIFLYLIFTQVAYSYLPTCKPNICVFKTGTGNVNLLTVTTNKMLRANNALVICNDDVSEDIKSVINCHKLKSISDYRDLDDQLTESATALLNEHSIYRILSGNDNIDDKELAVYKRWGLEIIVFPGVNENIKEF